MKNARFGGRRVFVRIIRVNGADSADFNGVRGKRVEKKDAFFVERFGFEGARFVGVGGRFRFVSNVLGRGFKGRNGTRESEKGGRTKNVERREFSAQRVERLSELRILFRSTDEVGGFGVVQTAQRKIDQCRAIDRIHLISLDKLFYRVGPSSRRTLSLRTIFQFDIQTRESQLRSLTSEKSVELSQRAVETTFKGRRGEL